MAAAAYRVFEVALARRQTLSPHMARLTFASEDVANMATFAPDQRVRVFLPDAEGRLPDLPANGDWWAAYQALPQQDRSPNRTYTIRHLRPEAGEVDIDFVLHGDEGPASAWALNARAGDRVLISAPDARHPDTGRGYEWKPPRGLKHVLLMADETALPAIAGILEELETRPGRPSVEAVIEVPARDDILPLPAWEGLQIDWRVREETGSGYGQDLLKAARRLPMEAETNTGPDEASPVEPEGEILWEIASETEAETYAWVAGETAAVRQIRAILRNEVGIDKSRMSLMGYWRLGQPAP